jgi:phosphate transport system substrate-binding protein
MKNARIALAALLAPLALLGARGASPDGGTVRVDGSSTVFPFSEAVAEEFSKKHPKTKVTVGQSGTGGGFKRFGAGETDFSNASRPIKAGEVEACKAKSVEFVELPVAFDGLTVVVNPANDWAKQVTVDQLRAMRSDMSVSEEDNVLVRGVAGERNAIGFFGYAYYTENSKKVRAVPVVNPKTGKAVVPTHASIEDGSYAPFGRPLFVYASKAGLAKPGCMAFAEFMLEHAGELAEEVGYVRLPQAVYERAKANLKAQRTGTQMIGADGKERHGPITETYR